MSQNQPPQGPAGPQPPYGPQPGPYPPYNGQQTPTALVAPPLKKRRVWLWVLLGVLALFLVLAVSCAALVGSAVDDAAESAASSTASSTSAASTASSPSSATFSLDQSCSYVTTTIEGVLDFGYDDNADSTTAGKLATALRQNVAQSPNPIHDDIALLITNLDSIRTGTTMKVADFTEPSDRVLDACDVSYTSPNDPLADTSDDSTSDPTEDPTEEPSEPATPKVSKKEKAYDALSAEQQDAVGEGQDYLDSQAFSKKGLIHQLSSDYGSQYKKKDAVKAVEYLEDFEGVDWKEQAVREAKSYRESGHFSTQGLIHQLESDYGSQFTHEQAVYGAKHSR